ncbi:hypothetical protein ACRXAU_004231 [Yersinia enterocolitica]|nr:hypothetical protein [Yersinia enterocolitica]HDW2134847.1 hypothetical protein [Yersinia enterocolitica]
MFSKKELIERDKVRTTFLMQELMRRTNTTNPNQFAKWFDLRTENMRVDGKEIPETTTSKKWYPIAKGDQSITKKTLADLKMFFDDIEIVYQYGPGGLWAALWGHTSQLVACMRTHPMISASSPLKEFSTAITISANLGYTETLTIADLARAVAAYRFHLITDRKTQLEGVGIYICDLYFKNVRNILNSELLTPELIELDLLSTITSEIDKLELESRKDDKYNSSFNIDSFCQQNLNFSR